jgi:hypothetical protein
MKNSVVTLKKNEFISNLGKRQVKKSPPKISSLREAGGGPYHNDYYCRSDADSLFNRSFDHHHLDRSPIDARLAFGAQMTQI